jgi:hypothetical protein
MKIYAEVELSSEDIGKLATNKVLEQLRGNCPGSEITPVGAIETTEVSPVTVKISLEITEDLSW